MNIINHFRVFSIISLIIPSLLSGIELQFKYTKDTKYKAEATITGEHFINGLSAANYTQYYKVITTVLDTDETGVGHLLDDGYYYINNQGMGGLRVVNDNILTDYYKDAHGITFAPANKAFPVMRNIPYLPDTQLIPGKTWNFDGLEVQDFFNDGVVTKIPVAVKYTFDGVEDDFYKTATITYQGTVDVTNDFTGMIDDRIVAIKGTSTNTLYFSIKEGRPLKENYRRHYQIIGYNSTLSENVTYEFSDAGERKWTPIKTANTEKTVDTIKKDIEKKKIDDVEITRDTKGIKLSLENIQFEPDSAVLKEDEKKRLDKIAGILAQYRDRPMLIIGHTTDRGTEEGRKRLSLERAGAVTTYLLGKGAINKEKTELMGKGSSEPVAPNTTEEGLRKNRRVEIYLLDE